MNGITVDKPFEVGAQLARMAAEARAFNTGLIAQAAEARAFNTGLIAQAAEAMKAFDSGTLIAQAAEAMKAFDLREDSDASNGVDRRSSAVLDPASAQAVIAAVLVVLLLVVSAQLEAAIEGLCSVAISQAAFITRMLIQVQNEYGLVRDVQGLATDKSILAGVFWLVCSRWRLGRPGSGADDGPPRGTA